MATSATQIDSDFKGDNLSVQMLSGVGDAVTVSDAGMTNGSPILSSATAGFTASAVGKLAVVNGAGPAGAALEKQIIGFIGATSVTLAANASTTITNAKMSFGTDNVAAIQAGFQMPHCLIPAGRYLCSGTVALQDLSGIHIEGRARSAVIVPTSNFTTDNFIKILGCVGVEMHGFTIDGIHFPDISQEIIIGDGTVANPIYGDINIHHMQFLNCKPIVCGVGANAGKTDHTTLPTITTIF